MGVIARQSIKRSILSFSGGMIGVVSLLFIYPLSKEAYGFSQFIISTASLFGIFFSFGTTSLVIRFFPEFKEKYSKDYLSIIFSLSFIVFFIVSILFVLFKETFINFLITMKFQAELLNDNLIMLCVLAILFILIQIFIFQASNYKRIVIPFAIHELLFKIYLPAMIILYYFDFLDFHQIVYGIVLFYIFSFIANGIYLKIIGGLNFGTTFIWNVPKQKIREMISYMGFSGMNTLSESLTTQIDRVMIPLLLTMSSNGIYSIFLFMSNTIAIPVNSLYPIASPIISEYMQKGDLKNVDSIYKKTSLNAILAGVFIFLILWANITEIVSLMRDKEQFIPFINVFLYLGIAKLIDMVTSMNSYIIIYSKFYRYNLLFIILLAILNVVLNYLLIGRYGIVGSALATMISILAYNIIKLIFIKLKFNIIPFTKSTLAVLIVFLILMALIKIIPSSSIILLSMVYKSVLVAGTYYLLIKLFNIDSDLIIKFDGLMIKLLKIIRK